MNVPNSMRFFGLETAVYRPEKLLFYAMLTSKRGYKPKMTYGSYIFFVNLPITAWLDDGFFPKKIVYI